MAVLNLTQCFSFIKSVYKKLSEKLDKETSVKIEKADDESAAHLEAQLKEELLKLHAEQYMMLRMVLSHPYNVENFFRTMVSGDDIQRLRRDLADIGQKRTVMEQLFEDKELAKKLEPYRSGVQRMEEWAYGALGGHVTLDVCLNLMQIEQEAKASSCAMCEETPKLPMKAEKSPDMLFWVADFPQDKIMVFTQFISTAKTLGLMLQQARIPFLYYYGCVSGSKRAQALDMFRGETKPNIDVLLVSLKAGGQSLNLACANRIIIIDPWWNVTAEQQAIGRAHRIGQKKECHVVHVWTDSDMDEKMLGLQKSKSEEIDYALQDDGHIPMSIDDEQREELLAVTSRNKGNGKQRTARPARQGKKRSKKQEAGSNKANGGLDRKRRKKS
ncbi:hypothetical protein E4U53_006107 [Claviceps sorghi]|nr:hypothetical protein E4U53_006107 [Claviceps sorghi]